MMNMPNLIGGVQMADGNTLYGGGGVSSGTMDSVGKYAEMDTLMTESLGSLMGVKGLKRAELLLSDSVKGGVSMLSVDMRNALTKLFNECKGSVEGLSMKDIQQSFNLCRNTVPYVASERRVLIAKLRRFASL